MKDRGGKQGDMARGRKKCRKGERVGENKARYTATPVACG